MKKFMILMLVLGLASAVNAGWVDVIISGVGVQGEGPESVVDIADTDEITIQPCQWISIDIIYTSPPPPRWLYSLSVDVHMTGDSVGTGEFGDPAVYPLSWHSEWDHAGTYTGAQLNPDGSVGVWTTAAAMGVPGEAVPVMVVDHILFHCTGQGDVFIGLRDNDTLPSGATLEIDDEYEFYYPEYSPPVLVHQVPEPMTMSLLGLGGLLLRKRKKISV